MKNHYLKIIAVFWIVIGITGLVGGEVNMIPSTDNNLATPTPTPVSDIVSYSGCVISNDNKLKTKPTPTATPFNPEDTKFGVEYPLSDPFGILKRLDKDCDGISDFDDNCIEVSNPKQEDKNKNDIGDACEPKKTRKLKRNYQQ